MKKYLVSLITIFTLLFGYIHPVNAAGSVSASFTGNSSVNVGSNISLSIHINSVSGSADGKMYAFGGYITYDSSVLQYVSFSGASGWTGSTGSASSGRIKVATVDYSMRNGVSSGNIGTVTFKAISAGSATVSMNTIEATDKESNLTASFSGKTITAKEPTPVDPKSSDSSLKSLSVSGYSLSPSFSSGTKSYSVSVPAGTSSVSISATPNHSKASIVSGTGTVSLSSDKTTASVKVKAEDGSTSTYTVTINRAKKEEPQPTPAKKSSNSLLKSLNVSGYTLYPTFTSGTKAYSMSVSNGVTGLNVSAIPYDSKAKVSIAGNHGWKVGKNTITITVTAEDGSKSVYKVTVTRAKKDEKKKSSDTNVDLKILSSHYMKPNFSNNTNSYNVNVASDVKDLELSVVPYDSNTKVSISGNKNLSDKKTNVVTILVTAEDGTTKTIKLNVTRTKQTSNAKALDIIVNNNDTMTPKFDPQVEQYTVTVGSDIDKLDLVVKVPEGVTYEVTGNENFITGRNIVTVTTKDKNKFEKTYQLTVNKEAPKAEKEKTGFIFGWVEFLILTGLLLLALLLLLLLLFRKKNKDEEEDYIVPVGATESNDEKKDELDAKQSTPINIDFKPEFNFNSKKDTDDDVIYSNGDMINGTDVQSKLPPADAKVKDAAEAEVYDPYDDNVTKDELFDAINEGMETKQLDKLEMLIEQERLNRKKKALKRKEAGKRSDE